MGNPNVMVPKSDFKQDAPVLSPHEITSLEGALGAHEQVIGATDAGFTRGDQGASPIAPPEMRLNRKKLNDQAEQIKKTLARGRPQPYTPAEKDKAVERLKFLESKFVDLLETRAEIHVMKRDKAEWQTAMAKASKRQSVEHYITEWKAIQRRLNPGDPEADNLHKLRKDR